MEEKREVGIAFFHSLRVVGVFSMAKDMKRL